MLKITVTGNELFDFVKLDPALDASTVNLLLDTAKGEAEQFLNTDFEQAEAPAAVKSWVFNRVAELYERRGTNGRPDFSFIQPWRVSPFK